MNNYLKLLNYLNSTAGETASKIYAKFPKVGEKVTQRKLGSKLDALANHGEGHFGLRTIEPGGETPTLGGEVRPSRVWSWDEETGNYNPTDAFADGPSAVSINPSDPTNYLENSKNYWGTKYVLHSERTLPLEDWNIDSGEIIMDAPKVLAAFKNDSDNPGIWERVLSPAPLALGGGGLLAAAADPFTASASTGLLSSTSPTLQPRGLLGIPDINAALLPEKSRQAKINAQALQEPALDPVNMFVAGATGGGGLLGRGVQAAIDPAISWGMNNLWTR